MLNHVLPEPEDQLSLRKSQSKIEWKSKMTVPIKRAYVRKFLSKQLTVHKPYH